MGDAFLPRELCLEDLEWLRSLAARLVRDPHTAEDAVQDTLVSALEGGLRRGSSLRAWLARVLRNALRQEWRGRARRAQREAAVGARTGEPEPHEVVAELALHRRLAEEVQTLTEPYRTAILLRYLRGREVAEIARELGVPEKTVRSRIERGLAQLRERLGRDREEWLACLALVRPRELAFPSTSLPWLLTMNSKLAATVAGLSLLGGYLVLRESSDPKAEAAPRSVEPAAAAPGDEREAPALVAARESLGVTAADHREPVPTAPASNPRSAAPAALLHGFVRTLDGAGVALTVVFVPEGEIGETLRTTSDVYGRFELPLPTTKGRLEIDDDEYACVAGPFLEAGSPPSEPIVVVAPAQDYAGRVRTRDGSPLARASVTVLLGPGILQSRNVGGSTIHLMNQLADTRTDELGNFRLERVGFVAGAELGALAEGYEPGSLALPELGTGDLELVLDPRQERETLHGLVLHANGTPAGGAFASLGLFTVACAADGTFALEREDWQKTGWLRAVVPGEIPAELTLAELTQPSSPNDPIVLMLGGPTLVLRGRVLDAAGEPVPGAVVFSPDTTPFGHTTKRVNGSELSGETTIEALLSERSGPMEFVANTRADVAGNFELRGLLARPYALFALAPRTLASAGPLVVQAGESSVELRLEGLEGERVAGRVVSRSGKPMAGIELTLGRRLDWRPDEPVRSARWSGFLMDPPGASWALDTPAARTDSDGRFDVGPLACAGAYLYLRGPGLNAESYSLDSSADLSALEIVVDADARFQVRLRRRDEADSFSLVDAAGRDVVLLVEIEGFEITAMSATIDGGRSGTVLTKEGTYTLVLHSGKQEVRREEVALEPGGLFELEF